MAYKLDQFNRYPGDPTDGYMTLITSGTPLDVPTRSDDGVTGGSGIHFENRAIQLPGPMKVSDHYYFHCKIKKTLTDQIFYIKLIKYNAAHPEEITLEQYIKTVVVGATQDAADYKQWADVEFCFTPYDNFDTVVFELQRTMQDDYTSGCQRYPLIIYEECSIINNLLPTKIIGKSGISLIKLGVQSRPRLLMNINGEEIRTSLSGIYELQNGIITVNFFSVVAGASENEQGQKDLNDLEQAMTENWNTASKIADPHQREEAMKNLVGQEQCLFGSTKIRNIDPFTLDYLYMEE